MGFSLSCHQLSLAQCLSNHEMPLDALGSANVPWIAVKFLNSLATPATNSHLSTHPGPFGQCPVSGTPMVQLKCEVAHQTPQQNVCSWTCRPDRKSHKQKQNSTKRYIQCDWIPAPWGRKTSNTIKQPTKSKFLKKERHLKLSSGWETQFAVPQFPSPNSMPNN